MTVTESIRATEPKRRRSSAAFVVGACLLAVAVLTAAFFLVGRDSTRSAASPNPSPVNIENAKATAYGLAEQQQLPETTDQTLRAISTDEVYTATNKAKSDLEAKGLRSEGSTAYDLKVLSYTPTPAPHVMVSTCVDLSASKVLNRDGSRADLEPNGKPVLWTRTEVTVTQQPDKSWLVTAVGAPTKGTAGECAP